MTALLALGPHIFEILPLNYQRLEKETVAEWASVPRFGTTSARQFTGLGDDSMRIDGLLFPHEFGGRAEFEAIRATQAAGVPVMMAGMGAATAVRIFGLVVILAVSDEQTHIGPDGQGRVLSFSIDLAPYGGSLGGFGGFF